MEKIDNGIDAPGVIKNLFIFSAIGFLVKFCFPNITMGSVNVRLAGFVWKGVTFGIMGVR